MIRNFRQINSLRGELNLPGDKSISHRSIIFSALAGGKSKVANCLESEDIFSTINCFRLLGCVIEKTADEFVIEGKGFKGFEKPGVDLFAGNSGTTARLISGILAAQDFETKLTGDDSLSKRPMDRIADPLLQMGAVMKLSDSNTLPVKFFPSKNLKPIEYLLPVASAQVKSAVLLAGLHLEGETTVIEPVPTRDHTERMLGLNNGLKGDSKIITVSKSDYPLPNEYFVPSDISTAAFFIVAALLIKNSEILIKNVSLNDTRTGILAILKEMGGNIVIENKRSTASEYFGDIIIRSSQLKNIVIDANIIPNIIDEIPVLSIAGLFAEGDFIIKNAGELRVKESDRIKSICSNYIKLGVEVEEFADGFRLGGGIQNITDLKFESYFDHRIAMTFAVLSSIIEEGGSVNGFEAVSISNPDFITQLESLAR